MDQSYWNLSNQMIEYLNSRSHLKQLYIWGPNKIYLYTRIATNTLTGLQEIFFFIGSGHCNILFWRAHCSESNDALRSWSQLVVNELSQIKDFDSYSLSSLDMRALIVWWIICLLHSRSNALSFIIPCILNRLRAKTNQMFFKLGKIVCLFNSIGKLFLG